MSATPKGGKRLAGSNPAQGYQYTSGRTAPAYTPPKGKNTPTVEDAVIDEILRSLAGVDFNTAAAPNRTLNEAPRRAALQQPRSRYASSSENANAPEQSAPQSRLNREQPSFSGVSFERPPVAPQHNARPTPPTPPQQENEYQAAAANFVNQQIENRQDTTAQRDNSQTQVFQPARPARRDTDRIPTLVDDEPRKKHPVLNRIVTLLVVILMLVAVVLGTKMVYILGPSMGWDLPDLSNVPVISNVLGLIPDAEEQPLEMPENASQGVEQVENTVPDPTKVTLDAETLQLRPGETRVLTATLDVENWNGPLAWATSDREGKVVKLTPLGPNTAQVEYLGEGSCAVAVQVGVKAADGGKAPNATCYIECLADSEDTQEVGGEPEDGQTEDAGNTENTENTDNTENTENTENNGEHVDIALNRDDFTLKVGEKHQLMRENSDKVTWTSSDENVATVANGIVTAVAQGHATITATGPDGTSAQAVCRVR